MYYVWALNRASSCRGCWEVVESLGCRPIRRKWGHWGHILKGHWYPIPISILVLLFSFQATTRWRALIHHAPHFVTFFPAAGSQTTKPSNCGLRLWKSGSNKTFLSLSWLSRASYHSVRRMTSAGAQQTLGSRGVLFRESTQEWIRVTTASLVLASLRVWGQPSLGNTVWCAFLLVSVLLKESELCPRREGDTKARALSLVIRHCWEAHSTHPSLSLSSWEKYF